MVLLLAVHSTVVFLFFSILSLKKYHKVITNKLCWNIKFWATSAYLLFNIFNEFAEMLGPGSSIARLSFHAVQKTSKLFFSHLCLRLRVALFQSVS